MEYVHVVENLIPIEYCNHLIDKFEKSSGKHTGMIGSGVTDTNLKKTTDFHPYKYSDWVEDIREIDKYVAKGIVQYLEHIKYSVFGGNDVILRQMFEDGIDATGFQIQKYDVGDFFNWHCDDAPGKKRLLAYIVYLNTMKIDDGGKTEFLNGKRIVPEAGHILFFPSTWSYVHRGEPIKNDTKYIITGFVYEILTHTT